MIIERLCPEFDARRIEQRKIRGDITTVYEAVLTADFIEAWRGSDAWMEGSVAEKLHGTQAEHAQ
jgi:uncharacterized protein YndB with AHSA1/START domain